MWNRILAVAVMCGSMAVFADGTGTKAVSAAPEKAKDAEKRQQMSSEQVRDMAQKGYRQAAGIKHEAAAPCPNHGKQDETAKPKDSCEKGIVKKNSLR